MSHASRADSGGVAALVRYDHRERRHAEQRRRRATQGMPRMTARDVDRRAQHQRAVDAPFLFLGDFAQIPLRSAGSEAGAALGNLDPLAGRKTSKPVETMTTPCPT